MNDTKLNYSLNDTKELRNIILENPTLPILIFCGEECWSGEFGYEQAEVKNVKIDEVTLINKIWVNKEEYKDKISDELLDYKMCENLTDAEFYKVLERQVNQADFIRAIIIYVDN